MGCSLSNLRLRKETSFKRKTRIELPQSSCLIFKYQEKIKPYDIAIMYGSLSRGEDGSELLLIVRRDEEKEKWSVGEKKWRGERWGTKEIELKEGVTVSLKYFGQSKAFRSN